MQEVHTSCPETPATNVVGVTEIRSGCVISSRKGADTRQCFVTVAVETVDVESEQEEVFQAELEVELLEISAVQGKDAVHVHVRDQRLVEVQKASVGDEEQKVLQGLVIQGWPARIKEVPAPARKYWNLRESLVVQAGITYKGEQVVVP